MFRRYAPWFAVFFGCGLLHALAGSAAMAGEVVHSARGHYSVQLPSDWIEIPLTDRSATAPVAGVDAAFCKRVNGRTAAPVVLVVLSPHPPNAVPPFGNGPTLGFGRLITVRFRTDETEEQIDNASTDEIRGILTSFRFDPGYEYRYPGSLLPVTGLMIVGGLVVGVALRGGRPTKS